MTDGMLSTEDIVAVTQAISAYAHHVDEGDGAAFAELFTEEAVLDLGKSVVEGGREAIAAFADSVPGRVPGVRHVMSTVHVRPGAGGATAAAYLETYKRNREGTALDLFQLGRYRFDLVRGEAGWLISRVALQAEPVA